MHNENYVLLYLLALEHSDSESEESVKSLIANSITLAAESESELIILFMEK